MTEDSGEIERIRKRIAKVDSRIVEAVAERMRLSSEMGRAKCSRGIDIEIREVEEMVIRRAKEMGRQAGVEEGLVEEIFRTLIEAGKREQRRTKGSA